MEDAVENGGLQETAPMSSGMCTGYVDFQLVDSTVCEKALANWIDMDRSVHLNIQCGHVGIVLSHSEYVAP